MSRSFKKIPRSGDRKDKFMKNYANRILRRNNEAYQNGSYKKCFCRYDICDYNSVYYEFEAWYCKRVREWERWGQFRGHPYPDREKEYHKWYKYYKAK
ncbi:MAG: hypothetical protein IKY94_15735 [Lachnospiraceae bacterium]|nr:hypothetical protein [Lachnospiraceae bacterium]